MREVNPGAEIRIEAIGMAWRRVMGGWQLWVAAFFIILLVTEIVRGAVGAFLFGSNSTQALVNELLKHPGRLPDLSLLLNWAGTSSAGSLLTGLITYALLASYRRMALRNMRGQYVDVGDLFQTEGSFLRLLGANLLTILIVLGPPLLLAALAFVTLRPWNRPMPGISQIEIGSLLAVSLAIGAYVLSIGALTMFTPMLVIDQKLDPLTAILMSIRVLRPHYWRSIAVYFLAAVCSGLGLLACCVGFLLTAPIQYMTEAILYRGFFDASPGSPP